MQVYEYSETYNAAALVMALYTGTGELTTDDNVTVATHSMEGYIDGDLETQRDGLKESEISAYFATALAALKAQVDNVTNLSMNTLMVDTLGFTLETVAPTPTNFTATPGASGVIALDWDSIPGVVYDVERATDAGFTLNLTTVGAGATDPFNDTGLTPTTHYYYRNNAVIPGMTDSAFAYDDAIAP